MTGPAVSPARIRTRLERLAAVGREAGGGVTRLPFTAPHREAMLLTAAMMAEAGLDAGLDEFGNVVGWRAANHVPPASGRPALISGSHLDTVPNGGMFDGALGIVGAIESAHALAEAGVQLRHPLVVVAFADEEGAGFGPGMLSSRMLTGEIPRAALTDLRDARGRTAADHLAALAAEPLLPRAALPQAVQAYLELHVEQGPSLHRMGRAVAAVETITGAARTTVTYNGRPNHAGTTPMELRADALRGAAELVVDVDDLARRTNGRAVGTVGDCRVFPGVSNVVPGRAVLRLDLRSPDPAPLTSLQEEVERRAHEIAARLGLAVEFAPWDGTAPQPLDPFVREAVLEAIAAEGHEPLMLPSWAGHDAQVLARHVPVGMIFVASTDGISHAPEESTPWPVVATGVRVLLRTILLLDAADGPAGTLALTYAWPDD